MTMGKPPDSERETVRPEVGGRLLPVADPGRAVGSTIRGWHRGEESARCG
jgi:hypothetical protein